MYAPSFFKLHYTICSVSSSRESSDEIRTDVQTGTKKEEGMEDELGDSNIQPLIEWGI